ncbi:MAG: hypothetical protein HYX67_03600 [Candidatus Melainabacteria bacterium]|nr:hypothetical protein [Candidatus Melainabacteria bacterium]
MNLLEFRLHASVFALSLLLWACALQAQAAENFAPQPIKAASGVTYTLFPQGDLTFDFVVSRPAETRADIYLCIPSAFTTPDDRVDGVYITNGSIGNASGVNKEFGGAMLIKNGQGKLLSTEKGSLITEKFLQVVQKAHGSLFQQFLIVHDCKAASFKDKSRFQRRAVCETTKGTFAVVESDRPITFTTFNEDLVTLGIKEALYCDMGAWDEGWYRSGTTGAVTKIGLDRSLTNRQSNWLLLKAPKKFEPKKKLESKKK